MGAVKEGFGEKSVCERADSWTLVGFSKETDDLKIWRCKLQKGLAETWRNEADSWKGPDLTNPKNHGREIMATGSTEDFYRGVT